MKFISTKSMLIGLVLFFFCAATFFFLPLSSFMPPHQHQYQLIPFSATGNNGSLLPPEIVLERPIDPYYDGPFNYQVSEAYYQMMALIKVKEVTCPTLKWLGHNGLGWNGHRPDGVWPVCMQTWKDCKVLTFGISNDPSFENALSNVGCEVWGHDPTISGQGLSLADRVHFVKLGLYGENKDPPKSKWPVRTLSTLMEKAGVTELFVLKVDVEGSEWSFLREAIDSGTLNKVSQLLIEVHFWPRVAPAKASKHEMIRYWYKILRDLYQIGFRVLDYHENPMSDYPVGLFSSDRAACCHELALININRPLNKRSGAVEIKI